VTLSYTQDTSGGRCRVSLRRRVLTVAPRPVHVRLESRRRAGGMQVRLAVGAAGGCWRGRAGTTIVRVSRGTRSRTIRLADLCERWSRRVTLLPGLRITAGAGGRSRVLSLRATGPRASYRVAVSFRGRVLLRRTVSVG
jgi:hypothetical protein